MYFSQRPVDSGLRLILPGLKPLSMEPLIFKEKAMKKLFLAILLPAVVLLLSGCVGFVDAVKDAPTPSWANQRIKTKTASITQRFERVGEVSIGTRLTQTVSHLTPTIAERPIILRENQGCLIYTDGESGTNIEVGDRIDGGFIVAVISGSDHCSIKLVKATPKDSILLIQTASSK